MKVNKQKIANESLYDMFLFANSNAVSTLKTLRNDLLASIDVYEIMLEKLVKANGAFLKIFNKIPEEWKNSESVKIKYSVQMKMNHFKNRINDVAELYEDVVGFATSIIKELKGIVFDEKNLPWNAVDLDAKNELLEMVNTRLMACTRFLGSCNALKPKILPLLIEVKSFMSKVDMQSESFLKDFQMLGIKLTGSAKLLQPIISKMKEYTVVDLTTIEDEYGRYEFNKWFHSWRRDIINWKRRAYHEVDRKAIILVSELIISSKSYKPY